MITLYHGSNVAIEQIDLNKCLFDKDFGRGFYLTDILSQAEEMAKRKVRIAACGEPIVTAFSFEEQFLEEETLNVKIFPDEPSEAWASFVNDNRHSSETGFTHSFDIVIGPVANDGVAYQLERYHEGIIDIKTLVRELSFRKLNRQYFFGTGQAIALLNRL